MTSCSSAMCSSVKEVGRNQNREFVQWKKREEITMEVRFLVYSILLISLPAGHQSRHHSRKSRPIHGGFSAWIPLTECSVQCGEGLYFYYFWTWNDQTIQILKNHPIMIIYFFNANRNDTALITVIASALKYHIANFEIVSKLPPFTVYFIIENVLIWYIPYSLKFSRTLEI